MNTDTQAVLRSGRRLQRAYIAFLVLLAVFIVFGGLWLGVAIRNGPGWFVIFMLASLIFQVLMFLRNARSLSNLRESDRKFARTMTELDNRIKATIKSNRRALNRLEPHLGCVECHGELVDDGVCPVCDPEES